MTAESVTPQTTFVERTLAEVSDPAAWLVVVLSVLIVVVALGLLVAGLAATGELPFGSAAAAGVLPTAPPVA